MVSVEWRDGAVRFIDQTKLPHEELFVETTDYRVVGEAIRSLQIRGAPAIGVAAAFAVTVAAHAHGLNSVQDVRDAFYSALHFISRTRPTAVNLFAALSRMQRVVEQHADADPDNLRRSLLNEATAIQREDTEACRRIGEYGAALITSPSTFLTHCNTGALATAGSGTAQSIITTAARQGNVRRVVADETRPLFQGARLTAWELLRAGIDVTVITDSTAAFLMQKGEIDVIVVGADRIASNGDVANKIGTYNLAVLAEKHNVPFYVAAPISTFDPHTQSGRDIPIEERNERDVTLVGGTRIVAEGARVFAPAFDMTPNELIQAIVTEKGVLKPPYTEAIAAMLSTDKNELAPQPQGVPTR
jgi:methylthioribose-1-phosphate isomerase